MNKGPPKEMMGFSTLLLLGILIPTFGYNKLANTPKLSTSINAHTDLMHEDEFMISHDFAPTNMQSTSVEAKILLTGKRLFKNSLL